MDTTRVRPAGRALDSIFRPRSIAVIGASRRRDSIGFALLHNLIANEFTGTLFPINPHATSVHSLKCFPSVLAVPDPIDLAVVAVPRLAVQEAVEQCVAKGVRGLVVITAGFAETGAEGAARETLLRDTVRAAAIPMIGPNCMGVINTEPDVRLNATFAPTPARAGSFGFLSQSGALGVAVLNVAHDVGIGLTQFVSMGNKADVSANDLLEMWEDDPRTQVIAMYLESFGNPRRFTEIAKRISRRKPILVVKAGRTAEGARAVSSHTGSIAGTDLTVSTYLGQCGVLRADTIEELFDVGRALSRMPLPAGDRVGIVTNAGGPAIMATDACVGLGLKMSQLAPATVAALRSFLPAEASLVNPVDMIASAGAESYSRTLAAVLADPGVDMAMVINVTPLLAEPLDILHAIAEAVRGTAKPTLAVIMATDAFFEVIKSESGLPPVYRFPESAAKALAMLARHAAWRRQPADVPAPPFACDDAAVAAVLAQSGDGYLGPAEVFRILEAYGIPVARWRLAGTPAEALAAAAELGYPVAVKAVARDLVHKTEAGAVRLDLKDATELAAALTAMQEAVRQSGHACEAFLLQEMGRGGHEVIFGLTTDPRFGPLLMFGLGGKYVEVFQDVRFGVLPLSAHEARDMVYGIRGFKLLSGFRGEPGADLGLLCDVLLRVAQLASRHPEIAELDINPFLASPNAETAKALDARIRVGKPAAG